NGFPTTGTITSIVGTETNQGFYPGSNDVSITKFSMSVEDVLNYIATNDQAGFLGALFAGNDTFTSNNQAGDHAAIHGDALSGFTGNDTFNVHISGGGEILNGARRHD